MMFLLVTPGFLLIFQFFLGNFLSVSLALGFAVLQIALAMYYLFFQHEKRLIVKRKRAIKRFAVAPIWTLVIAGILFWKPMNPWENDAFLPSFMFFIFFLISSFQLLLWLPIIDFDLGVQWDSSNCGGDQWSGLDSVTRQYEQSQTTEKTRNLVHRSVSVAFTVFATLSLNVFTLIGPLRHPGLYFVTILLTLVVVFFVWKALVSFQKGSELQFGSQSGGLLAVSFIVAGGLFNFLVSLVIATKDEDTWIDVAKEAPKPIIIDLSESIRDSLNWSDFGAFFFLTFTVVVATVGPIFAAEAYRSKISFTFDESTVTYSLRGNPIVFIDQANCRVRSLVSEGRIRPFTIWLPVDFVTSQGEVVRINMKWTAWGVRKGFQYRYRYSIVHNGRERFLLDTTCRWTRFMAKIEATIDAVSLRSREECGLKVLQVQQPRSDAISLPVLNIFGIPPYIPPKARPEAVKGRGTEI